MPHPDYPNTLSHLTQKECDKIVDIVFEFRNQLAYKNDEIVIDPDSSREKIEKNNEELREMDRLLDRLTPGSGCDAPPQQDEYEDEYEDDSASLRDHFHFGS